MYHEIHHTLKLSDTNQYEPKTTAKLCTCNKCHKNAYDICFYVPFSTLFVSLGTIQIISGIFYFMKNPVAKLIFSVSIGFWVVIIKIKMKIKGKIILIDLYSFSGHFMRNQWHFSSMCMSIFSTEARILALLFHFCSNFKYSKFNSFGNWASP